MEWALIILILLLITYAIRILTYLHGWNINNQHPGDNKAEINRKLSIILPVRNEARNILSLLEDLRGQDYPEDHFEIIIVNDHSTDQTANIVRSFISENTNIRLIEL